MFESEEQLNQMVEMGMEECMKIPLCPRAEGASMEASAAELVRSGGRKE